MLVWLLALLLLTVVIYAVYRFYLLNTNKNKKREQHFTFKI